MIEGNSVCGGRVEETIRGIHCLKLNYVDITLYNTTSNKSYLVVYYVLYISKNST